MNSLTMQIPFSRLEAQYATIRDELVPAWEEILGSQQFIKGPYTRAFEEAFAAIHHRPAVACSNGTSALYLALAALSIGPGDEVILPANTFIGTAEAVSFCGATPVFCDVDPVTHNATATTMRRAITPQTRALIPVHLFGNPCDMPAIVEIASEFGLAVVEDCAQAHLATVAGQPVGTYGDAAAFSFFPGKNLGAFGDAGLVLARDDALARRVRRLSDHGRREKYIHEQVGFNFRMAELQAAVLNVKLKHLPGWTEKRSVVAERYTERLRDLVPLNIVQPIPQAVSAHHLFVVEVPDRDILGDRLADRGIATGVHYPVPLQFQPAYASLGYRRGDLPVVEKLSTRVLSLPIYPELELREVDYVCDCISEVLAP